MITQAELERQTYEFGRARASKMMAANEEGGRAINNPYASAILRRFVLPLASVIETDVTTKRPGRNQAHVSLLAPLDREAVAYLAVRVAITTLLDGSGHYTVTGLARSIGRSVYHELCLACFEQLEPDLFHTLVDDFERRMTKSERHRMTVFKMQAEKNGIELPKWGQEACVTVGAYLTEKLAELGLVEISLQYKKEKAQYRVELEQGCLDLVMEIKEHVAITSPYFLPCVEKPKDWIAYNDGGFHTVEMRRLQPFAIKSRGARTALETADLTTPLAAINYLQSVPWRINRRVLATMLQVSRHFDTEEVLSFKDHPEPDKPDWLTPDLKPEDMTDYQKLRFRDWKKQKASWFTDRKLRATKFGRFHTATTVADKFKEFDAIYFVYFADFRGRLYAQTSGVSPQGSDMQKALLEFSDGKPLHTREARDWFCINGANKWGYDKAPLADRVSWVRERHDLIVGIGRDPLSNTSWREADTPFQFLAWCIEYAAWYEQGDDFLSHLPIGMDGSCNGLQNFSAMLRDEVGGKATNLVPGDRPNDIYQMVADVTMTRLLEATEDDKGFRSRWLHHGINRKIVKRSVMTLPYGSTRYSCSEFIASDYLKSGAVPEFSKEEYGPASRYLAGFVWSSIGAVVVKARDAMDWLQLQARLLIKSGEKQISWKTPSGFVVVQDYREQESYQIRTRLCGSARLRLNKPTSLPDLNRHKNGVAPNFIHSYDAAHLTLVTKAAGEQGLSLAMIHDDYGTHAADAQVLYTLIRRVFVDMYEQHDPLAEFPAYSAESPPPAKGNLNLAVVMDSPYFFS